MIKKFLYFFNKNQKKSLLILFVLMFISTILEIIGLGFIFTIIGSLNLENAETNILADKLGIFFELDNTEIFFYLLLVFLLLALHFQVRFGTVLLI